MFPRKVQKIHFVGDLAERYVKAIEQIAANSHLLVLQGAYMSAQLDALNAVAARIAAAADRIAALPPGTAPEDLGPVTTVLSTAAATLETVSPPPPA
jgi:hypothetical protein